MLILPLNTNFKTNMVTYNFQVTLNLGQFKTKTVNRTHQPIIVFKMRYFEKALKFMFDFIGFCEFKDAFQQHFRSISEWFETKHEQ